MTNHTELDMVIDALLAEQGLATDPRPTPAPKPRDHWLRRIMRTGAVQSQQPRR